MISRQFTRFAILSVLAIASSASASPRDIQFRSVDFETGTIEVFNFGDETIDLDGWRFCSHDENEVRRYSSSSGLNGVSIAPGESLFVHFNNDADASIDNAFNISDFGGRVAGPFDQGPYSIGLYINSGFGNGANLADHIQWSIDGIDNTTADDRSDEAQTGQVWTDQSIWIPTTQETRRLELNDLSGAALHGPENYSVILDSGIEGDYDGDGFVGIDDFNLWRDSFASAFNLAADGNRDGVIDAADYTIWQDNLTPPPVASAAATPALTAVPEPSSAVLLLLSSLSLLGFRKR